MERDVINYIKNCHRFILSKPPEPALQALLESIRPLLQWNLCALTSGLLKTTAALQTC